MIATVVLLALPLMAQMPDSYFDIDIVKVKMGKRSEFDAINKRMAGINRKNGGDHDLAYEVVYGDSSIVSFVSMRASYAAAERGSQAFEAALTKELGAAGMQKLYDAWDADVDSERQELRRHRWDLTANAPADAAAFDKLVGQSRWIRTMVIHTRPGKAADYEAELKAAKDAEERTNPGVTLFVDEPVAGQSTGVFYLTTFLKSLGDLDNIKALPASRGSDCVESAAVEIGRFLPEQSNLPDEMAAADPQFWSPGKLKVK